MPRLKKRPNRGRTHRKKHSTAAEREYKKQWRAMRSKSTQNTQLDQKDTTERKKRITEQQRTLNLDVEAHVQDAAAAMRNFGPVTLTRTAASKQETASKASHIDFATKHDLVNFDAKQQTKRSRSHSAKRTLTQQKKRKRMKRTVTACRVTTRTRRGLPKRHTIKPRHNTEKKKIKEQSKDFTHSKQPKMKRRKLSSNHVHEAGHEEARSSKEDVLKRIPKRKLANQHMVMPKTVDNGMGNTAGFDIHNQPDIGKGPHGGRCGGGGGNDQELRRHCGQFEARESTDIESDPSLPPLSGADSDGLID